MTTPTPTVRGDVISAIRQAIVELNHPNIGRGVYRAEGVTDIKYPSILLDDGGPTDALSGDGGPIAQTRVVTASVYQANSRDSNPRLGHDIAEALHGRTITIGQENTPATWKRCFLRCRGRVEHIPDEGVREDQISITVAGPPCP